MGVLSALLPQLLRGGSDSRRLIWAREEWRELTIHLCEVSKGCCTPVAKAELSMAAGGLRRGLETSLAINTNDS